MSEVNASDRRVINSKDDVLATYQGAGDNAMTGLEVELAFFDPNSPDLAAMSLPQNLVLKNAAQDALTGIGQWVRNEPTSELLEVNSIAAKPQELKKILDDANTKIKILTQKAEGLGLKRSYFQELPDKTAQELLSRIVQVDRYIAMYDPYRADMKKCVEYFAICKSNQVSVSHRNPDHLLENVKRLYLLAPFLFLLTDNSAGFCEGQPHSGHVGMTQRYNGLLEGRGGFPPYVFTARNGDEFIDAHINHAINNPLFMHYDLEGNLIKVPSGDWSVTFNALKERGLNTASNYYLAESLLWPDVKIAALKDENGVVTGHRYEGRMFGVGIHQHQTALLIMSALAFKQDFAAQVDELLQSFGLSTAESLNKAYANARNHNGKFFDIAYGTGTMSDFAARFADLIETAYDGENLDEELQPLLTICRTGCTDGKVNRKLFPTLEKTLEFQRDYELTIFDNPNQCARQIFEKELANSVNPLASACCNA